MIVKDKGTEKSKRGGGFSTMPKEKVREIAAMGGRKAHALGTAHKWNSETARIAGRLGGLKSKRSIALGRSLDPVESVDLPGKQDKQRGANLSDHRSRKMEE